MGYTFSRVKVISCIILNWIVTQSPWSLSFFQDEEEDDDEEDEDEEVNDSLSHIKRAWTIELQGDPSRLGLG